MELKSTNHRVTHSKDSEGIKRFFIISSNAEGNLKWLGPYKTYREAKKVSDGLNLSNADWNAALIEIFKEWANEQIANNNGLVKVSDFCKRFWRFMETPLPDKINEKEANLIWALAEQAGFGVAPDIRYHYVKPVIDGKIVISSGGHGKDFKPSKIFNKIRTKLRLGVIAATIDSHVDQSKIALLKQLIDDDTNLSAIEKQSLHSYLFWRINSPSDVIDLKAQLEKLSDKEKATVGRLLVEIALAAVKVNPQEVKQIEKLYVLLGLDKSLATGDIHSLTVGTNAIAETQSTVSPDKFHLDKATLAIHESQTEAVQNTLHTIFGNEDSVEEGTIEDKNECDTQNIGIDSQHYSLYKNLISKDQWQREEVDKLCKQLGLMTSGAIETINDWSFARVDDPVFEEKTDAVHVNQEIVEELEG